MKLTKSKLKQIIKEAITDQWDNRDKIAMSRMAENLPDEEQAVISAESRRRDEALAKIDRIKEIINSADMMRMSWSMKAPDVLKKITAVISAESNAPAHAGATAELPSGQVVHAKTRPGE